MSSPFRVEGDTVRVVLGAQERSVLVSTSALLDGDVEGRLEYKAYPDDPDAEERYRDLVGDDLAKMRQADRVSFDAFIKHRAGTTEDLEAFMRVVGDVRLTLADRLGIEDDGWEEQADLRSDPELALLAWLGYIQDAAVGALNELL